MTNLEEMNSNPNPKPLSWIGAAVAGFILQAVFHLNMAGMFFLSLLVIIIYSVSIALITFFGEKYDNKILLHFNEFWITLDVIMKNKLIEIAKSTRI